MQRTFHVIISLLITTASIAQNSYHYTLDLINVKKDRVKVTLQCPKIKETSATFVMPYVIPGSYAWKEYGRFLKSVKAFDTNGKKIAIKNVKNLFVVAADADKLAKIEYWVNDTWDDKDHKQFVFQPGGSNIEAGKNFVINHHAFEGYFEGYKNIPFQVEVLHPENMFGSTWSQKEKLDSKRDLIRASTYFELVDNPLMYCVPDTASFMSDTTRIHIACFSDNKIVRADSIREWMKPLAASLKKFIGYLPVKDYYFIYYFTGKEIKRFKGSAGLSGFGALEHHHCSFYFLPEEKDAREMVQDVGEHEFLHILTPLNLHSRYISDFNFKDPVMSQHLWLYEGVTEYFSWLSRIQSKLVTEEDFFNEMQDKLGNAQKYGEFSFTTMSTNVLKPEYQEKYSNVYQKGALMAMLLDQLLLKQSNGSTGLVNLVKQLMAKYGSKNPFEDDQLFKDIEAMTSPEAGEFIKKYIIGSEKLPMTEYMKWFGYEYAEEKTLPCYFVASFNCHINAKDQLQVDKVFGSNIGLLQGDIILEVNGIKIGRSNFEEVWNKYFQYNTTPGPVRIKLISNGVTSERLGQTVKGDAKIKHYFHKEEGTTETNSLHDAWLNGEYKNK